MKPLPAHLRAAALGLALLTALSGAAVLHAESRFIARPATSHLTDTDNDVGCEVNPLNLC